MLMMINGINVIECKFCGTLWQEPEDKDDGIETWFFSMNCICGKEIIIYYKLEIAEVKC